MNPLRYKVRPSSTGGWTTYLDLADDLGEDALLARLSAACGQPVELCRTVAGEFVRQLIAAAREGRACPNLFDLMRTEPTSGGAADDADAFHGIDDIEFNLSLGLLPKARKALRKDLHIERTGSQGKKTSLIAAVVDLSSDQVNHYTAGAMLLLRGKWMKLDPRDPETGVYLTPGDGGDEVRCTSYGPCTKGRIVVLIPPGTTGPQRLSLRVRVGNSLRRAHYSFPLQPA